MAGLGGREGETSQALLSQPPHPESAFQPLSPLLHRPQPGALSHLLNSQASSERLSKLGHLSVTAKANEPQRADSWALHSGLMDASPPVSSPPSGSASGLGPAGSNSSISERKLPTTREVSWPPSGTLHHPAFSHERKAASLLCTESCLLRLSKYLMPVFWQKATLTLQAYGSQGGSGTRTVALLSQEVSPAGQRRVPWSLTLALPQVLLFPESGQHAHSVTSGQRTWSPQMQACSFEPARLT